MVIFGIRLLEGMFVVGSAGCIVVLFLTAIDDLRVLLGGDGKPKESTSEVGHSAVETSHGFSRS